MGKYIEYTKYVLEHKKNVFKTCWKSGLYLHAFMHDMSKFSPSEFPAYADWFNGEYGVKFNSNFTEPSEVAKLVHEEKKELFDLAWQHHFEHNKHHWKHWCYDWDAFYDEVFTDLESCKLKVPKKMPKKYIKQMICDWEAMSIKFGGSAQEYYLSNYYDIELNSETRYDLECMLGLNAYAMTSEEECWLTIGENYEKIVKLYGEEPCKYVEPKKYIDSLYSHVNEKYDVDVYQIMVDAHE